VFLNGSAEGLAHDVDTLSDVAAYLDAASLGGDTAAGHYEDFSGAVVHLIHTPAYCPDYRGYGALHVDLSVLVPVWIGQNPVDASCCAAR
jgi:hypothetical protein